MAQRLIVVDGRTFVRDAIADQLSVAFPQHSVVSVPHAGILRDDELTDDSVVICGTDWTKIRARSNSVRIVVIVEPDCVPQIIFSIQGVITSDSNPKLLVPAIDLVLAGGEYLPFETVRLRNSITCREMDVLRLMFGALPNQIIADRLGCSISTVKIHIKKLYRKLKVRSRNEIVARWQ